MNWHPNIANEPVQKKVKTKSFAISQGGVNYTVQPLYEYDLTGMVVSFNHHNGNNSLHKRWNDHLNVADVCVVWQDNAKIVDLNAFKFWNGEFTCNYRTKDLIAYQAFHKNQLSNNHLLADSDDIRDEIKRIKIGDQIRFKGWLSEYGQGNGPRRGTSTVRTDTGDGACETIYVKDFRIIDSMSTIWRTTLTISLILVIITGLFWTVQVARGKF
ncbi:MAG: hypothetical protein HKM24_01060 [Gammaproteobacteria bacterium]|nr:hypothetical protein [Gammaproteobacteria bacterium]